MNIGQLDGTRLIISLCKSDLEKLNITFEELDSSGVHSRRVLRALLLDAFTKTGIDISGKRILIEAMKHDHGCLMVITVTPKSGRKKYRIKRHTESYVFVFGTVEDILCCIGVLYSTGGKHFSSSVFLYGGKYYLSISASPSLSKKYVHIISEFSCKRRTCGLYVSFLLEHAKIIASDNAIEKIGSFL